MLILKYSNALIFKINVINNTIDGAETAMFSPRQVQR